MRPVTSSICATSDGDTRYSRAVNKKPGTRPGSVGAPVVPAAEEQLPPFTPFGQPVLPSPFSITIDHPDWLTLFSHVNAKNQSDSYQSQA